MHNKMASSVSIYKPAQLNTSEDKMQEIKEFLELDCTEHSEYEILYNYSILHTKFQMAEIQAFYFQNINKFIGFKQQRVSISEVLSRCYPLMDKASTLLYCAICANKFIAKNSLDINLISSECELIKFNNLISKKKCSSFVFKLDCEDRSIEFINRGEITPYIYNLSTEPIILNRNTFSYLINDNVDIPSLMAYELNKDEIQDLASRMSTDPEFNSKCCKFIEDQGIINTTMQIIASLCDMKLKGRNVEHSNIYKLYCRAHFSDIYVPFSKIERISDLGRQEIYFLYLSNTKNLEKDIPGILEAIEDEADTGMVDTNTTYEKIIDVKSSISLPSLDIGSYYKVPERSIRADILDLALKNDLSIPYNEKVYRYLAELSQEEYFDKICKRHSRNLINSGIELPGSAFLSEVKAIISFLENDPSDFSLETVGTSILVSSIDSQIKSPLTDAKQMGLPMIDFKEHAWLDGCSANAIMQQYINSGHAYCIKKLASNFLAGFDYSPAVCDFFHKNYDRVDENMLRGMVMCKLNITVEPSLFSSTEIKGLLENCKCIYSLKNFILFGKIQKKYIEKFLVGLTDDQSAEILNTILMKSPSNSFSVSFVQFISKKYEFSFIFPVLSHFIDGGQVEIIREIQKVIMRFLEELFIDETHLSLLAALYKKAISSNDLQIRKNNDKILSSIAKACKLLGKEAVLGNIKTI